MVIRDAINAGDIPGPRYLANGKEMARRDGELVAGITAFADGPDEMREVIRHHVDIGVDNIKLSMSGEEVSLEIGLSCAVPMLIRYPRLLRSDRLKTATSPTKRQRRASMRRTSMESDFVLTLELEIRSRCVRTRDKLVRFHTTDG